MRIEVRFRGLTPSESLKEHTVRRLRAQLSRFGQELTAVVVRIGDINGPRGGVDKRCQIHAQGPRMGSSSLEAVSRDFYSAVDLAVERLSRAVGRTLERGRVPDSVGRLSRSVR